MLTDFDRPVPPDLARRIAAGDDGVTLLARSGQRVPARIEPGDMLLRPSGGRTAVVVDAAADRPHGGLPGRYALVRETYPDRPPETRVVRLAGPDGLLLSDRALLRLTDRVPEAAPQTGPRPTLRAGARGAPVAELQARLNGVHAAELAAGRPGLERCPLTVDGIFGDNSRQAVIAFQRLTFPGSPKEWDGVVGPKTWAALELAAARDAGRPAATDPDRSGQLRAARPRAVGSDPAAACLPTRRSAHGQCGSLARGCSGSPTG